MNNLTQKQRSAKKAHLDKTQAQMMARYEKADTGERNAIIGHIEAFLPVTSESEKNFWRKFRRKLEILNEQ